MSNQYSEEQVKALAAQLRKPEGEMGVEVGNQMNQGNAPMNLHTLAVVNPKANDRILELGMGNGYFVKNILNLDNTIQYTGLDYSSLMVEQSKKLNARFLENSRAYFIHGTADQLPFEANSFNKIFTVNTIYFWEEPKIVFSELRRVLTTDGMLIVSVRPKHNMEKFPVTRYGFTMYSKDELVSLLQDNGFIPNEITEIREPDGQM